MPSVRDEDISTVSAFWSALKTSWMRLTLFPEERDAPRCDWSLAPSLVLRLFCGHCDPNCVFWRGRPYTWSPLTSCDVAAPSDRCVNWVNASDGTRLDPSCFRLRSELHFNRSLRLGLRNALQTSADSNQGRVLSVGLVQVLHRRGFIFL